MEKRESEALSPSLSRSDGRHVKASARAAENSLVKPTREDVSRCIGIWAREYRLQDEPEETTDTRDLLLPSRPWIGRSTSSLKRFE
jgi:hypothetical protein